MRRHQQGQRCGLSRQAGDQRTHVGTVQTARQQPEAVTAAELTTASPMTRIAPAAAS